MRERNAVESMAFSLCDAVLDRDGTVYSKRPLAPLTGLSREVLTPFDLADLFNYPSHSWPKQYHRFLHSVFQPNLS